MKLGDIYFPKPLLDALRNDRLVVFAGAGVSMGKPANLPDFKGLTKAIAQGTGKKLKAKEPEDRFLGTLKNSGINVHKIAAKELCRTNPKPTQLHRNLLQLFLKPESVRIVTTNFDLLFEQATGEVFDLSPEIFLAPALPLGSKFRGIVHVHGSVERPEEMILTDADFGRAYLVESEGWARRFLVELFRSFTILFVGYSHDDTIMNYLARALPASEKAKRFALTKDNKDNYKKWQILGIESITYHSLHSRDHSALYKGIAELVEYTRWRISYWQTRIKELAEKGLFYLSEEEEDILDQALSDATKTHLFTDVASSPEWIDWLARKKYLDALFKNGDLGERDAKLAHWLITKFARTDPNHLFLLIGVNDARVNPDFWHRLARFIGRDREPPWDKDLLSRWISLLLATAPVDVEDVVLLWLGERCIDHGLFDSTVEIFDAMSTSSLRLQHYVWPNTDTDDPKPPIIVRLELASGYYEINYLWENGLKPNLDRVVEPVLENVIKHLRKHHNTLSIWGSANRDYNPASSRRSAIEPNEQDKSPESFDVLIDAGRDCLEWLAFEQPEMAAELCDRLAVEEVPLLRRLAVHTLFIRKDLTANKKIDWFLSKMDLHAISTHHELFRAVTKTYPKAGPKQRQNVINAILDYHWPNEEEKEKDVYTAEVHFDWLHELQVTKPNCSFAKEALDKISEQFSDFEPSEHPEHLKWLGNVESIVPQSPWTVENLLSKSPKEWIEELLSFKQEKFLGPDRQGLVFAIGEAAKQNFQWGLVLANALTDKGEWGADIWSALLNAWSKISINENQYQEVLRLLSKNELHDKNALQVAKVLYGLVKNNSKSCSPDLLSQANQISRILWESLDQDKVSSRELDWITRAINHPAGILAQFWLESLSLWRKEQDPLPCTLNDEYNSALSVIIQDKTMSGKLGRCILAGRLSFFLTTDEKWTKENLLPLFGESASEDDYHAVWSGFLMWQSISPSIIELLEPQFLDAVRRIRKDYPHGNLREMFINTYTTMLVYLVKDPINKWIPRFFENANEEDKRNFTFQIKRHLVHMDDARREELWQRWLKPYWENRLNGIPSPLESEEINLMLAWLPYLNKLFPEAVDLAIQMPSKSLERNSIVHKLNESNLWQNYPEAVANLLIYLQDNGLPDYGWYKGKELIDKLFKSNISQKLKKNLEELVVELRLK